MISVYPGAQSSVSADTAADFVSAEPGISPSAPLLPEDRTDPAYAAAVKRAAEGTPEPADPVPDPEKAYSRYAASRRKTGRHLRAEKILTRVLAFAAVAALALLFFLFFLK